MEITQKHIDKILAEAKGAKLPAEVTSAQATAQSISISSFKTLWPKIRPFMLFAVSILTMFRRGDAANGISQAIAFIDMVVSGTVV